MFVYYKNKKLQSIMKQLLNKGIIIKFRFYFSQMSLFASSPDERTYACEILRHLMSLDS
jgi:hypothetical protein